MAFCETCGTQLKEGAKFCSKCGSPVNKNDVVNNGQLHIHCKSSFFLGLLSFANVYVSINGNEIGSYQLNKGFDVSVPIQQKTTLVNVKFLFRKYNKTLTLDISKDYHYYLVLDLLTYGFSFILQDDMGNRIA
ncbi:MAG: zinc ribbon domain-containing protein [Bacteroidaceae bacterium]|nr:zinc ribbon domain-containing protein [Bacteroidaceae bacterium]